MSFFNYIKDRYLADLDLDEPTSQELQAIISKNIWPADHIELNGKIENIYSEKIELEDICNFFVQRMPGLGLQINNLSELKKNPAELMAVKFVCFHQLAGLWTEKNQEFTKAFKRRSLIEIEEEVTLH